MSVIFLMCGSDWKVAGGLVTGEQSVATFENILGNATNLNTG
jgi:hypothetical protein